MKMKILFGISIFLFGLLLGCLVEQTYYGKKLDNANKTIVSLNDEIKQDNELLSETEKELALDAQMFKIINDSLDEILHPKINL